MSVPTMLSFDEIHKYMLDHGGKVTNHDLVKHFKKYLTDPSTRDEARNVFKKHVNTLASIKNQNNEKWLILKKKYMPDNQNDSQVSAERLTPEQDDGKESSQETVAPEPVTEPPPYRPPPVVSPTSQNSTFKYDENIQQEPFVSNVCSTESDASVSDSQTVDHTAEEAVETTYENNSANIADVNLEDSKPSNNAEESFDESNENVVQLRRDLSIPLEMEQKISVKERKQMFNRMASEGDVLRPHPANNRKIGQGADDDDRASVVSLDPKGHEWIVAASQGNYHVLAKLCTENPKYAKIKDPATGYTAMHWASKYGNEDLVKLLAGVYRPSVNERSNGGYTPLHIAAQYRNENVCKLLINTYDADPNVRDWSGRKPRQYLVSDDASLSADAFRNFKMKAAKKNADKDLGFLRIGSLNVRVKKTTEAFSNFLGVGPSRSAAYTTKQSGNRNSATIRSTNFADDKSPEHIHKTWGSADNIQNDVKIMPPPQNNKVRRKNMANRRTQDYSTSTHSRSTPSTPNQPRASIAMGSIDINTMLPRINSEKSNSNDDSDSDTVFGFDASWQTKREGAQFS